MEMKYNELFVVLTENNYLFFGISGLLKEKTCILVNFAENRIDSHVLQANKVTIVVDCLIIFSGVWNAFNTLQAFRPDATVVWLARSETGRVFPPGRQGDCILDQKMNPVILRHALKYPLTLPVNKRVSERVQSIYLTKMERDFLHAFLRGVPVTDLSVQTGKPTNLLYRYRQRIILKTGIKSIHFLQLIYKRNEGLPGV